MLVNFYTYDGSIKNIDTEKDLYIVDPEYTVNIEGTDCKVYRLAFRQYCERNNIPLDQQGKEPYYDWLERAKIVAGNYRWQIKSEREIKKFAFEELDALFAENNYDNIGLLTNKLYQTERPLDCWTGLSEFNSEKKFYKSYLSLRYGIIKKDIETIVRKRDFPKLEMYGDSLELNHLRFRQFDEWIQRLLENTKFTTIPIERGYF